MLKVKKNYDDILIASRRKTLDTSSYVNDDAIHDYVIP